MMSRARFGFVALGITTLIAAAPSVASAQEPRLVGRLPDAAREQVQSILDSALATGLPTEPMVDRALEGAAKGAPPDLIVSAVSRLLGELGVARDGLGDAATAGELTAGASALRAGATQQDLAELRRRRPAQPLIVAASVLADLVAAGVPTDTAVAAVLALAGQVDDSEYVAFRRNVERDIALGASPSASVGVNLGDAAAAVGEETLDAAATGGTRTTPRKRKP